MGFSRPFLRTGRRLSTLPGRRACAKGLDCQAKREALGQGPTCPTCGAFRSISCVFFGFSEDFMWVCIWLEGRPLLLVVFQGKEPAPNACLFFRAYCQLPLSRWFGLVVGGCARSLVSFSMASSFLLVQGWNHVLSYPEQRRIV